MKTIPKLEFWVTNISPRNVTLADLALNIKAYTTVNLLDKKHYQYTLEQLLKSRDSGSIFNKNDRIQYRYVAPPKPIAGPAPILHDSIIPSRDRSILTIKTIEYDELKFSDDKDMQKQLDEEYARENADLVEADAQRFVTSKKG